MNTSSGLSFQAPRKAANQNIQVYTRVRPLNARERTIRSAEVIEVISPKEVVARHTVESKLTKKFTFDRVFGTDSRQADVYRTVVAPLIEEVLSGYNCTVFAYGQTGTGKTHTMVGTECAELKSSWEDDSDIGIIPRALSHLFDELRMLEMEFSMRISYLELYNEELCDLLSSDDSVKIRIFDDTTKKGSVIIQGLEEIPVHSKDDVYKLLEKGKERRKTATTLMNAQSSRSHTVFSILVHIRENGIDGEEMLKIGKLNLVDLAGSENVTKAGNEKGIRARETVNINQSLLTLGRVITALVERTPHIPYRESKLTRLLQESLGGRTKTSIIATISPGHKDIEETLSTLEYAHRAKNIQNKPEVNQKLTKKTVLKDYTEEIDKLKRDLMAARDKNGIYLAEETFNEMTLKMDSQNRELNEKMLLLKALKDELQSKEKLFNEVSLNLVAKAEELKRTEQNLTQTQGVLQQTKKILLNTKKLYKEKKVLLQSHVKTEAVLTNQAQQIMEVADIATKDTHQLHSTIERRRDVDVQIQTACERFVERMHSNFDDMKHKSNDFQHQHNSYSKLLLEEFSNTANAHKEMLGNTENKLLKVNDLCQQSLTSTNAMVEKYAKMLNEISDEHKVTLLQLLQELDNKQIEVTEIQNNVQQLEQFNEEQKMSIDKMHDTIVKALQRNSDNLCAHTSEMKNRISEVEKIAMSSVEVLNSVHSELSNEQSLLEKERAIRNSLRKEMSCAMEELIAKMTLFDESSVASALIRAENLSQVTVSLKNDLLQKQIEKMQQSNEYAQSFCIGYCDGNVKVQDDIETQTATAFERIEQHKNKSVETNKKITDFKEDFSKGVSNLIDTENKYYSFTLKAVDDLVEEEQQTHISHEEKMNEATAAVKTELSKDSHAFKGHIEVANCLTSTLQQETAKFEKDYNEQISKCITDVSNFKQSELQTYAPTGATPSKRNFIYPRNLAATSPHTDIVKRFRKENDWSDIDTTVAIDEGSEDENDLKTSNVQEISNEAGMLLNSTPIDLTNPETPSQENLCIRQKVLRANLMQDISSYIGSPRKASTHNSLSSYSMEDKENL